MKKIVTSFVTVLGFVGHSKTSVWKSWIFNKEHKTVAITFVVKITYKAA
jgi:hypothetical protein